MRTVALEQYVLPIESFDPHDVVALTEEGYVDREALSGAIRATCARFDAEVQTQYFMVVRLLASSGTRRPRGR